MIIAEKPINKEAFRNTMIKVWRSEGWVQFTEVGENRFLIEFNKDEDRQRVIKGRPWSFDRWLLCLHAFEGNMPVNDIQFTREEFWLQVHNMPLGTMTEEVGKQIGKNVGKVLKVHSDDRGIGWGKFMRIRVEMYITKALMRGMFLTFDGRKTWVQFKYERLPTFCLKCGVIRHNGKSCQSSPKASPQNQYGVWLRAPAAKEGDINQKRYGHDSSQQTSGADHSWRNDGKVGDEVNLGKAVSKEGFKDPINTSDPIQENCVFLQPTKETSADLVESLMATDTQLPKVNVTLMDLEGDTGLPTLKEDPTPTREVQQKSPPKPGPSKRDSSLKNYEPNSDLRPRLILLTNSSRIKPRFWQLPKREPLGKEEPERSAMLICFLSLKSKLPSFVFLMETKCKRHKVECVKRLIKFDNSFVIDCKGFSGGLAFLWKNDVEAEVHSYSQNHISLMVKGAKEREDWLLTGFYGSPVTARRQSSWKLLQAINPVHPLGWLCIGDFNEILFIGDKSGGAVRAFNQIESFRDTVELCGLSDLGFVGNKFTWSNGRHGASFTKEMLDRAFGNSSWMDLFPSHKVYTLPALSSDHCPIFVTMEKQVTDSLKCDKPFRFEAGWSLNGECHNILEEVWTKPRMANNKLNFVAEGLRHCKDKLLLWSRYRRGNFKRDLKTKMAQLSDLQISNTGFLTENIKQLQKELDGILDAENPTNFDLCLENLAPRVSGDMNSMLIKPYSPKEIEEALFQMNGLSSPGPDGFPAAFYQQHWSTVGSQVCVAALFVLNSKGSIAEINSTFITLIPKKKTPLKVSDFRPISLCNVLYKVISKAIANRLKKILPLIISPHQSAFIPERLITDNVIVAFETLHTMKCKLKGKEGYMALKLDMSKAYDRIEWGFLRAVLSKMGFNSLWIDLVMGCVDTVSYAILVNGCPQEVFHPSRGIRQGDPLSPYFFILCAEALSNLIGKAEERGLIHGVPVGRGQLRVSHLFFADDSLIFCKANALEWGRLFGLLKVYEDASGQRLNIEKTSIIFSKNTLRVTQSYILEIAGMKSALPYENYLGLPSVVGRAKHKAFQGILDKVRMKLSSYTVKLLSQAGREIFIKAVVQTLPTYTMSVFKLPNSFLKAINSVLQNYWWGQQQKENKIHWVSWSKLGKAKDAGGMGFRDLEYFNKAMLAKQCWRLIQNPHSLAAKVLKAKYFKHSDFQSAKLGASPSFIWRSFIVARPVIFEGSVWRVGTGENIHIWQHKWLHTSHHNMVLSDVKVLDRRAKVADLIDSNSKSWKRDLVNQIFDGGEAEAIIRIPISSLNSKDKLIWKGTHKGCFSVRSAYHMMKERDFANQGQSSFYGQFKKVWQQIWHSNVPPSDKVFLWRACLDALPTQSKLFQKRIVDNPLCPICNLEEENVVHVL
ncbi:hypothetical protein F2P56_007609 [Juglans regia]|uniref:Reverse transcriptase domain-containing protein n=1 Tax=Juglans regia TaxID=51240 RepID=A0A833Y5V8_JUGRE|nr:hypothetical protein F2P56_007609 [Juglans regia]